MIAKKICLLQVLTAGARSEIFTKIIFKSMKVNRNLKICSKKQDMMFAIIFL